MSEVRRLVFNKLGEPKTDKQGNWGGAKQTVQDRLTIWDKKEAARKRAILEEQERVTRLAEIEAARLADIERARVIKEAAAAAEAQRLAEEAIKNETDLAKAVEMEAENKRLAAEREANAAIAAAEAEQRRLEAQKAADAAAAKSSTLTHSVGAYGAKSSLRENWKARITNREKAEQNLSKIAAFFSTDDIVKAATAYAKKNRDSVKIDGIPEFYNDERSGVRG